MGYISKKIFRHFILHIFYFVPKKVLFSTTITNVLHLNKIHLFALQSCFFSKLQCFNFYENIVKMQNIISYISFDFEYKYNPNPDCRFHETKILLFFCIWYVVYIFFHLVCIWATFSPYIQPWIEIFIIHQKLKIYGLLIWAPSPISQSNQWLEAKHNQFSKSIFKGKVT